MKTFQTRATVTADRKLTVDVPPEIEPGEHSVTVAIEEGPAETDNHAALEFRSYPVRPEAERFTYRREDIYGDDGR